MVQLRTLCILSFAVLTLATVTASTALAAETEAGLLYLPGESGALTFQGKGGIATGTGAAGIIRCGSTTISATSTQTENHVVSGTGVLDCASAKETKGETKVACKTGVIPELIELPVDYTLFNAQSITTHVLEPGIGLTVTPTAKIKCGPVAIVEEKGTSLGLVATASLVADVTTGTLHFVNAGELCDNENAFCKKAQEKGNELLANFSGSFESYRLEMELPVTLNKMMLVDD